MESMTDFETLVDRVKAEGQRTVVVAAAEEPDVLMATVQARLDGIANFVYVGDADLIRRIAAELGLDFSGREIVHEQKPLEAARQALQIVKEDRRRVLMKGKIGSGTILGMVLKDEDLKQRLEQTFLSHSAIFAWENRLKIFSDAGLNISPTIEQKRRIALNAIEVARKLGMMRPRVAFLSAVEKINPKMPSSVEAAELAAKKNWEGAVVGGPLAFDGAMFEKAYQLKGVPSPVEGNADILICPNIETGNVLYKTLAWMLKLDMAGVISGAAVPFILTSRADSARVKFLSIATTLYLST